MHWLNSYSKNDMIILKRMRKNAITGPILCARVRMGTPCRARGGAGVARRVAARTVRATAAAVGPGRGGAKLGWGLRQAAIRQAGV